MTRPHKKSLAALLAAACLGASPALAQETPPDQPQTVEEAAGRPGANEVTLSLQGGFVYDFETDLRGVDSEVSIARTVGEVGIDFPEANGWRISLSLRGEFSNYDFSGDPLLAGLDDNRFEDFWTAGASVSAIYSFDNQWTAIFSGFAAASLESGADFGDSITGGGIIGAGYQFNRNLFIGGGLLVTTRLEDDPRFIPALQIRWNINDRLTFSTTGAGRAVTPVTGGFGAQLAADLDEAGTWKLVGFAAFQGREYRLDDDGDVLGEGVLRDDSVAVGVGFNWAPSRNVELAFGGGLVVYREFELLDEGGHELDDIEADASPFVGLRLTVRF